MLPPFSDQVDNFAHHLTDVAWLPREFPDPFGGMLLYGGRARELLVLVLVFGCA